MNVEQMLNAKQPVTQEASSDIRTYFIKEDMTIKDAMRQMGDVGERILFVVDAQNRLIGSLNDGDIRRALLRESSLYDPLKGIYNKDPLYVEKNYNIQDIKKIMMERKVFWIPVLNKKKNIVEVLLWRKVFGEDKSLPRTQINLPVVIMAGGKGTRLDPFTKILPKPLIPFGDKAVIEVIIDRFYEYGCRAFFVSIQHKSRMIKAYFEEKNPQYDIHFIEEEKPLGTAGSLKLVEKSIEDSFILSNCDIITEFDYSEAVDFHRKNNYDITIVGSYRHFSIPYGVCHVENGGQLSKIQEKPEFDYLVNTGMYIVNKKILRLIPKDEYFDMTELINNLIAAKGKVGVFPIDAQSWVDLGQWEDYHQSIKKLKVD